MKGKIILQDITNPVEGMKIVYGNELNPYRIGKYTGVVNIPHEVYPNHPWNGLHQVIDGESGQASLVPWELSELKQLAIEYGTRGRNGKSIMPVHKTVTIPLHPDDWNTGLTLLGNEVEFEMSTLEGHEAAKTHAKLSLPTPVEETWGDIIESMDKTIISPYGIFNWLQQHYLPPKKK